MFGVQLYSRDTKLSQTGLRRPDQGPTDVKGLAEFCTGHVGLTQDLLDNRLLTGAMVETPYLQRSSPFKRTTYTYKYIHIYIYKNMSICLSIYLVIYVFPVYSPYQEF